jgi:hypothetical protein
MLVKLNKLKFLKQNFYPFILGFLFGCLATFSVIYSKFISTESKFVEEKLFLEHIKKKEFISFDENFYDEEKNDISLRWLWGNGSINIVIPYDQIIKFEFLTWSYNISRRVKVYLDGYLLTELNLTKDRTKYISPFIYVRKGIHQLRLETTEKCLIPAYIENSGDYRCLSIAIGDFKKVEVYNLLSEIDSKGWYSLEDYYGKGMRWIEKEATIDFIVLEKGNFTLEFFTFSFYKDRIIKVYIDDKLISFLNIKTRGSTKKISMSLDPGVHTIRFVADGCDSPYRLSISEDKRCLSVAIVNPILYE